MKQLLKLEYFALMGLFSYLLIYSLDWNWFLFLAIFLLPDLGMVGYQVSPKIGSVTYNLVHHQAVGIGFLLLYALLGMSAPVLLTIGSLILAHSNFDRLLGYGLKHGDSFKHTHLGMIGGK